MNYQSYLLSQNKRPDALGAYAFDCQSNPDLLKFDQLESQLDCVMSFYPGNGTVTLAVLASHIEYSHVRYMELKEQRMLNSAVIKRLREEASQALNYLSMFWEEFSVVNEGREPMSEDTLRSFRQWLMVMQEQEIQYRYEERKLGVNLD